MEREGKRALTMLDDEDLARFVPIDGIEVPAVPITWLWGVDTGSGPLQRLGRRTRW